MTDDFKQFRQKLLEDPATLAAYESKKPAYEFAIQLAELRRRKGLSQAALAKLAGVTQPEIARLESAEGSPTLDTMARVLSAVGADLDIRFKDESGKLVRLPMTFKGADRAPRTARSASRTAEAS